MAGRALSIADITPFFRTILSGSHTRGKTRPLHLGICVSGGPDSMALAYLLQKLQASTARQFQLSGWIVDHKARSESTEEASLVQENLSKIGIESKILTMEWPMGVEPSRLPDFESQARNKRYQLLAHAAKTHHIQHLFLGHHQDDQIETIIMRIIRNGSLAFKGLGGMAESWPIPTAFDEFGVHVTDESVLMPARSAFPPKQKIYMQRKGVAEHFKALNPGGVSLQRPLLSFPKVDLIATCNTNGVPYVIDPTNGDPESSLRNAVRYLRQNYKLPSALGRSRLLELQRRALDHINRVKIAGEAILSTCRISLLDLRSGFVCVRIPFPELPDQSYPEEYAYAISKLAEIVTPKVRVNHGAQVPLHILSQFFGAKKQRKPLTFDCVYWVPDRHQPQTWTLSRQPLNPREVPAQTRTFNTSRNFVPGKGHESEFLLWDNRYWIRAFVSDSSMFSDLVVRPLQHEDLDAVSVMRRDLPRETLSSRKKLLGEVRAAAPGLTKFALPVMTYKEKIVALPTFNYELTEVLETMGSSSLHLDVRYNSFSLMERTKDGYNIENVETSPSRDHHRRETLSRHPLRKTRQTKKSQSQYLPWNGTLLNDPKRT